MNIRFIIIGSALIILGLRLIAGAMRDPPVLAPTWYLVTMLLLLAWVTVNELRIARFK